MEEKLEAEIKFHIERWIKWYDFHPEAGNDLLEAALKDGTHIIDRNLLAAYLSLRTARKAAEDNKRLQTWLIVFAVLAVVVPATIEVLRYLSWIP